MPSQEYKDKDYMSYDLQCVSRIYMPNLIETQSCHKTTTTLVSPVNLTLHVLRQSLLSFFLMDSSQVSYWPKWRNCALRQKPLRSPPQKSIPSTIECTEWNQRPSVYLVINTKQMLFTVDWLWHIFFSKCFPDLFY